MTNMESEMVAAAARALLDLAPPRKEEQQQSVEAVKQPKQSLSSPPYCHMIRAPSTVFRSLAPDVHYSLNKDTRGVHGMPSSSSPAAVSFSSASSVEETVSGSSLDGYASETTLTTNPNHTRVTSTRLVEYQQQQQTTNKEVHEHQARFAGTCVSLALPQDSESLSPLHCFMRRYCVEAFAASEEDLAVPRYGRSHTGRVTIGQVGIRCIHCKHRPPGQRQERAVCFPSEIKNLYHSIETFQRRHAAVCKDLPVWVKASLLELTKKSRAGAGGRRQYWEESARRLGMETTASGVRFVREPGDIGDIVENSNAPMATAALPSLVLEEDKPLVTDFLYLLMEQMTPTTFTEEDRTGGRSKVKDCPVGMAGMQCKHCCGRAGFGRYFPTSVNALASANSDRNILNHIKKCRKVPDNIRENLLRLQKEQATLKNRRGQRKEFFHNVWQRLHGEQQQQLST